MIRVRQEAVKQWRWRRQREIMLKSNRLRLAKQQLCMCNTQQQRRQTLRNGQDGQGSFQKSQIHVYS